MIEGGGIGVFHAKEIGPLSVHVPNGVVEVVAENEAHAVTIAKKYLTYFQGRMPEWTVADQRVLRNSIPGQMANLFLHGLITDPNLGLISTRHFLFSGREPAACV